MQIVQCIYQLILLLLLFLKMAESSGTSTKNLRSQNHLIIVQHGLIGRAKDLEYLVRQIQKIDGDRAFVHATRVNEGGKTFDGVESGAQRIAKDIIELIENDKENNNNNFKNFKYISFIGNSLGGLYVRHAISILYDTMTGLIAGLEPLNFISIATPHLGFEPFYRGLFPTPLLNFIMHTFIGQTGFDLNLTDDNRLLYNMATSDQYLIPLKAFRRRRLYANLNGDFMVPFTTASIDERLELGLEMSPNAAIVHIIPEKEEKRQLKCESEEQNQNSNQKMIIEGDIEKNIDNNKENTNNNIKKDDEVDEKKILTREMSQNLNPLFEKVIVNFPSSNYIPLSHNKIAAIERDGFLSKFVANVCGFNEGTFVMDDLATYVTEIHS